MKGFFFLKVWAKNTDAHYTRQNTVHSEREGKVNRNKGKGKQKEKREQQQSKPPTYLIPKQRQSKGRKGG